MGGSSLLATGDKCPRALPWAILWRPFGAVGAAGRTPGKDNFPGPRRRARAALTAVRPVFRLPGGPRPVYLPSTPFPYVCFGPAEVTPMKFLPKARPSRPNRRAPRPRLSPEALESRVVPSDTSAPAILQWFDGSDATVERRAADVFDAGYGGVYLPPPGRADSGN